MIQMRLDFNDWSRVVCAFGSPSARYSGYRGPHHCPACAQHVAEACAQFAAAVARGEYDAAGFTPAERRAREKRNDQPAG